MTTTLKTWFESLRATLTSARTLILAGLYALLLVSFYFFIATREATVWQVFVTYALLLLVPAEFFVFQATILEFAREHKFVLKQIGLNALKLAVVTIPIVIVGAVVWWLMNKLQARYPAPPAPIVLAPTPPKAQPIHWPTLILTTLKFVLFGIAFPLAAIHLWIEASACDVRAAFGGGAKAIFGTIGRALGRAFSSESAFVYGLGLILFVLGPYLILLPRLPFKGAKTAFAMFSVQVVVAFALILIGWIVTVTTLARANRTGEAVEIKAPVTVAESPA